MGGHKVSGVGDPTADAITAQPSGYVDARLKRTGVLLRPKMEGTALYGWPQDCRCW